MENAQQICGTVPLYVTQKSKLSNNKMFLRHFNTGVQCPCQSKLISATYQSRRFNYPADDNSDIMMMMMMMIIIGIVKGVERIVLLDLSIVWCLKKIEELKIYIPNITIHHVHKIHTRVNY
jgi:hypothetical protein